MAHIGRGVRWHDIAALLLGIWVAASPWMLGYADELPAATWNAAIVGGAIALLAAIDLDLPAPWEAWGMAVLGVWLVVSTWLLGPSEPRAIAALMTMTGLLVTVLALWALFGTRLLHRQDDHAHGH